MGGWPGERLYDITLPLDETLACWPGDADYRRYWTERIADGATVNLSSISLSVHMGTHADAPYHYDERGICVDAIDPAVFVGPAVVVDVRGREVITRQDLLQYDLTLTPRVLLLTGAWLDHTTFPLMIPIMSDDAIDYLCESGVKLVGVDVPSVDPLDSKTLPIHKRLGAAGITILESLALANVAAGPYTLIGLPLRLVGADGAPVRAVLVR